MKKILLSFGVFLLLFSFSLCNPNNGDAPLSIISPEASDEWEILGTYEIKWKGIESVEKVDIELWKNTEKMYTLANDKNNDGTYEWKVPENTIIADDYKIKIISQNDESVTADSNAFSIVRRRTIKVISPSANDEWEQERNHTIKWESSGNKEISNIDIELWSGSSKHSDIATGINNTGSYDWNLGEDINTGSSYKIKIIDSSDETINTVSDGFNIVEKKVISIQSPATGTKWGAGTTQTIEWTTDEGVIIDNVNIELWYDGSKSDNIATDFANTGNTGSYDWTVPADTYTDGGYKIKIIDFDNPDNYGITNSDFIIYNESLKGTWIEKPDNGYKIIFEELIMHIEEDSDEDGTYEPLTEGDYNYDKTNNTLHSNFTKIAPSAVGDDESTEELVELPYTFEQSIEDPNTGQDVRVIITVNSAELTTSFVFNNESPAEGLLGAFLNNEGDPLVLNHSDDWKQTMIIKSEIITQTPPAPSNTQTINDDTGQSYKFDSQGEEISLTYKSYERTGLLTTESEEVTETAVWGSLDTSSEIKTFSVTNAEEDNVRLINGTYKYRVIKDAILISRPEEAGEEAPKPQYLEKEEEE